MVVAIVRVDDRDHRPDYTRSQDYRLRLAQMGELLPNDQGIGRNKDQQRGNADPTSSEVHTVMTCFGSKGQRGSKKSERERNQSEQALKHASSLTALRGAEFYYPVCKIRASRAFKQVISGYNFPSVPSLLLNGRL